MGDVSRGQDEEEEWRLKAGCWICCRYFVLSIYFEPVYIIRISREIRNQLVYHLD